MPERSPLRESLRSEVPGIALALGAAIMVSVANVALAGTSAALIVRAAQRPTILSLTFLMGTVQLLALGKAAGRYAERVSTHQGALRIMSRVRALTARRLEPLVPAGLGARGADVIETVIGDVDRVQDLLVAVAGPVSANLIAALCAIAVGAYLAPATAIVFVIGVALVGVVLPLLAARAGEAPQNALIAARAQLRHVLDDAARAGDEYRGNGASAGLYRRCTEAENAYDRALTRVSRLAGLFGALNLLVAGLTVLEVVADTQRALELHGLAQSLLAVPALLALSSLELVGAASGSLLNVRSGVAAAGRLADLVARPWPVHDPLAPLPLATGNDLDLTSIELWRDNQRVLSEVNASWRAGDVVAISGPSGSGKTTLAHLVARFIEPRAGRVTLGETDYANLTGEAIRTRVGYVSDDPHVFATSLAANVRLARPEASVDEILDVLDAAGLGPLLMTLPEGLATELGGATSGLSGGERRRLGVARALLAARPVLVLDEPTEGLDEEDARGMLGEVARRQARGTLIVISHQADQLTSGVRLRVEHGRLDHVDGPTRR